MLETERLILRPFREGDVADVLEYLKEPTVNCFACMKVHSLEEARKAVQERAEDSEYIGYGPPFLCSNEIYSLLYNLIR